MEASNLLAEKRLGSLKGIGDKTEKLFGKVGIDNLDRLVHYYPRAYDLYSDCVSIGNLKADEKQSVSVRVERAPIVKRGAKTTVSILKAADATGRLEIIWFNMPYLRSVLKKGSDVILRGMVVKKGQRLFMEHPEIFTPASYEKIKGSIQPIYSLTNGLKSKTVAKAVGQVFGKYSFFDYLPDEIINDYSLAGREQALNGIHFPKDESSLKSNRRRIVFDEFMFFLLKLAMLKNRSESFRNAYCISDFSLGERIISNLGFELTGAQKRVWAEIREDLKGDMVMNRLIQGDVGSGKTIIAFLGMISMMKSNMQSTLMAPTEILARQHYEAFIRLLAHNGMTGEGVLLLTGSLAEKEKKEAHKKIKSKDALVVIGTHAIIQDGVEFADLGLVITDEQHRFGVRQRRIISEKGDMPHIIVMSATPIPRTLAMILYSDMSISVLDEMPEKRLKIKNCVVDTTFRKTAYSFMEKEIQSGRQAYVICPMIEPNEDLACENVIEYTDRLKKLFHENIKTAMLHGRMSAEEKQKIMEAFFKNEIQILVSTTVVEVGIDVPNATVMLIENAERFGLAQLHQLRGRIGRGEHQSYCIFMQGNSSDDTNKRLEILNNSNDGFFIAQEDLRLRGQGDLFGLRQSGRAGFILADPMADSKILNEAASAVKRIMKEDPTLSSAKYSALNMTLNQIESRDDGVL